MKFIQVLLFILILSCGSNKLPRVGETAILSSKSPEGLLAARSEDAYDKMDRISQAMDEVGLKALIAGGDVVILENNTAGRVLDIRFGTYKIRVQSGPYKDQELVVSSQFVDKK